MRRWVVMASFMVALIGLTIWTTSLGKVGIFSMFTYGDILVYSKDHLYMVFWAVLAAAVIGIPLGILVTRPGLTRLSPLVLGIANIGQSVPSIAVIAIVATLGITVWFIYLGFNTETAIVALFIYGLLPVVRNSYASMKNINPAVVESALFEEPHHAPRCSCHHPSYVLGCGRGEREEGAGSVGGARIDTV